MNAGNHVMFRRSQREEKLVRVDQLSLYAVLTGDIIGSRRWNAQRRPELFDALRTVAQQLQTQFPAAVRLPIDLYRGDSWQLLIVEPQDALRIAIYIRTTLRLLPASFRLDSRIAIGLGTIDFLPTDRISQGDGPAFQRSGQILQTLEYWQMGLDATDDLWPPALRTTLQALVHHLDFLIQHWTPKQGRAIRGALLGQNQETIGRSWPDAPISQQAVAQHLQRSGWSAVEETLHAFEIACKTINYN